MRVSTEDQAKEGYSLPAQKRRLLGYSEAHNWTVAGLYSDEGISAKFLDTRPQALQMMEDAKKHMFDIILTIKIDRLCRNTKELLQLVDELDKYKVVFLSIEEQIDYTTPVGRMVLTFLGSIAELERSTITARTNMGKEQKRLSGLKVNGGFIPFAYDFIDGIFTPNERKDTVQLIFSLYNQGMSANRICFFLQDRHILSPQNKPTWERGTVIRILKNETYKGFIRGVEAKNIEPIISQEVFQEAQAKLDIINKGATKKQAKDDFYFADVAYCNVCGRKLSCKREAKPRLRKYYVCKYNSSKHITAKDEGAHSARMENKVFEDLFLEYFENFTLDFSNVEIKTDEKKLHDIDLYINSYENKKAALTKRKSRILVKYMDGLITDEDYKDISTNTLNEIKELEDNIQDLISKKQELINNSSSKDYVSNVIMLKNKLNEIWPDMTDKQKRLFISSTIKKISIARGRIVLIEFK
jgi:site-specific DNA recombinase